jgi:hypothetical protein
VPRSYRRTFCYVECAKQAIGPRKVEKDIFDDANEVVFAYALIIVVAERDREGRRKRENPASISSSKNTFRFEETAIETVADAGNASKLVSKMLSSSQKPKQVCVRLCGSLKGDNLRAPGGEYILAQSLFAFGSQVLRHKENAFLVWNVSV